MKKECKQEDFYKLDKKQFYQVWFIEALTDRQIAKRYNVSLKEVKSKRKEFGLNWWNCAVLWWVGGKDYKHSK